MFGFGGRTSGLSCGGEPLPRNNPNAEVIAPTYRTEEYPFVRDEDHNFMFGHHLIYTHDASGEELQMVLRSLTATGETVRVLGPETHLEHLKKEFPDEYDFFPATYLLPYEMNLLRQ
jgi:hypothetical protein